jgi:hypothetical protein
MKAFNILPKHYQFSSDYDPRIKPNVINSFAAAAFRFHTLIQVKYLLNLNLLMRKTIENIIFIQN